MVLDENFSGVFLSLFGTHPIFFSFLIGLIGGWWAFFWLAFFSAQGYFGFWISYIFFVMGLTIEDILWFLLGRTNFAHNKIKKGIVEKHKPVKFILKNTYRGKYFTSILIAKSISATKQLTFIYLGTTNLSLKKFMNYLVPLNVIYTLLIGILGWYAGKGFEIFINVKNSFQTIMLYIFILIVFYILLKIIMERYIIKKEEKILEIN